MTFIHKRAGCNECRLCAGCNEFILMAYWPKQHIMTYISQKMPQTHVLYFSSLHLSHLIVNLWHVVGRETVTFRAPVGAPLPAALAHTHDLRLDDPVVLPVGMDTVLGWTFEPVGGACKCQYEITVSV